MTDTAPSTPRIVPGAPPPSTATKSQRKKRRTAGKGGKLEDSPAVSSVAIPDTTSAALTETAPAPSDIAAGAVADELVAHPPVNGDTAAGATPVPEPEPSIPDFKPSPIVEMLQKRIKATGKKIVRVISVFFKKIFLRK
jgi:hypothetical protein